MQDYQRKTLIIIIFLILFFGCSNNQNKKISSEHLTDIKNLVDTLTLRNLDSFYFNYDVDNFREFGIEFFEHDLQVGPQDVLMVDSSIYVLDQYHNNLKKINLQGEIIKASAPLSDMNIWLNQFEILMNKIFVISELDSLYIYSLNLDLLDKKYLQKGNGRIFYADNQKIVLYYPMNDHEFIELDEHGVINNRKSGIEHKKDYESNISYSNASIEVDNRIILTESVDLRELIHYISDRSIVTIIATSNQLVVSLYNY